MITLDNFKDYFLEKFNNTENSYFDHYVVNSDNILGIIYLELDTMLKPYSTIGKNEDGKYWIYYFDQKTNVIPLYSKNDFSKVLNAVYLYLNEFQINVNNVHINFSSSENSKNFFNYSSKKLFKKNVFKYVNNKRDQNYKKKNHPDTLKFIADLFKPIYLLEDKSVIEKKHPLEVSKNPVPISNKPSELVERFSKKSALETNLLCLKILFNHLANKETPLSFAEIQTLKQYKGYGGIKEILYDPGSAKFNNISSDSIKELVITTIDYIKAIDDSHVHAKPLPLLYQVRNSVNTAFYTQDLFIQNLYKVLESKGLTDSKIEEILEPSVGNGRFIYNLSDEIKNSANIDTVELDPLTYLFNDAINKSDNIHNYNMDFTRFIPRKFYNFIISNIPFGLQKIYDDSYNNDLPQAIHSYYFHKASKLLDDNGVLIFITSAGFMDSKSNQELRKQIVESGIDFVSAFRFDNSLFSEANTKVVTDLVILKRTNSSDITSDLNQSFINSDELKVGNNIVSFSQFFKNNPDLVFGNIVPGGMYNKDSYTINPTPESTQEIIFSVIHKNIPENLFSDWTKSKEISISNVESSKQSYDELYEDLRNISAYNLVPSESLSILPRFYHYENNDISLINQTAFLRFFDPLSAMTCYLIEYNPDQRIGYGFVKLFDDIGFELGYFDIAEYESVRRIERDFWFEPTQIKDIEELQPYLIHYGHISNPNLIQNNDIDDANIIEEIISPIKSEISLKDKSTGYVYNIEFATLSNKDVYIIGLKPDENTELHLNNSEVVLFSYKQLDTFYNDFDFFDNSNNIITNPELAFNDSFIEVSKDWNDLLIKNGILEEKEKSPNINQTDNVTPNKTSDYNGQLSLFDDFDNSNIENPINQNQKEDLDEIATSSKVKNLVLKDLNVGQIWTDGKESIFVKKNDWSIEKISIRGESLKKILSYTNLRDAYNDLINNEYSNYSDENKINELRNNFNRLFDSYVKTYCINKNISFRDSLKNISKFDVDATKLYYVVDNDGNKNDVFFRRSIFPEVKHNEIKSLKDAVLASIFELNYIDKEFVLNLFPLDKPFEQVMKESQMAYFDPIESKYVLNSVYFSGDIISKIEAVKDYMQENPDNPYFLEDNLYQLEKNIPEKLLKNSIDLVLGMRWIPLEIYNDFIASITGNINSLIYNSTTDSYDLVDYHDDYLTRRDYGTPKNSSKKIILSAFHNMIPSNTMKDPNNPKFKIPDDKENLLCAEAVDKVHKAFSDWVWADKKREEKLVELYNHYNNRVKIRQYNDELDYNLPGLSNVFVPKKHQVAALNMCLENGGGLVDHLVGRGKTLVMIMTAMEMRRRGLAKKPCFAVLGSTVPQIVESFMKAYPNAKILAPTKAEFRKDKRMEFFSKVANEDWDCIIMSHEQLKAIPNSKRALEDFHYEEMEKIMEFIESAQEDPNIKPRVISNAYAKLEKLKDYLEKRTKDLNNDKGLTFDFENMGIDALFIDESHYFKNISYETKLSDISGLNTSAGSGKALDLMIKKQTIENLYHNGQNKGLFMFSGTPISNSITEMYGLMRYLNSNLLKKMNCLSFDGWLLNYGRITKRLEPNVINRYNFKRRLSEYVNIPELATIYSSFAHIADETNSFVDQPEMENGEYTAKIIKMSEAQKAFNNNLLRFSNPKDGSSFLNPFFIGKNELTEGQEKAYMLMCTNLSTKMSIDMRFIDNKAKYDPNGKIGTMVKEVYKVYKDFDHLKGTQIIYSDLGTPKNKDDRRAFLYSFFSEEQGLSNEDLKEIFPNQEKTNINVILKNIESYYSFESSQETEEYVESILSDTSFNLYEDIREHLIEAGIPKEEIAFIHDYNSEKSKLELFDKVNAGEVRVVLGSTKKLGVGVNIQQRCIAVHHVDIPWRPADMQQRNGRALRPYNTLAKEHNNNQVKVFTYCTEKTIDAYKYKLLSIKQSFISQIKRYCNKRSIKEVDDSDSLEFAKLNAILSGNDDVLIHEEKIYELKTIQRDKKVFYDSIDKFKQIVEEAPTKIESFKKNIERTKKDIATVKLNFETNDNDGFFFNKLNGKTYNFTNEPNYTNSKEYKEFRHDIDQIIRAKLKTFEQGKANFLFNINGIDLFYNPAFIDDKKTKKGSCEYKINETNYTFNFSEIPGILLKNLSNSLKNIPEILEKQEDKLKIILIDKEVAEEQLKNQHFDDSKIAILEKEIQDLEVKINKAGVSAKGKLYDFGIDESFSKAVAKHNQMVDSAVNKEENIIREPNNSNDYKMRF